MPYNSATDFVGLWRAVVGGVEKAEMPGLDFVVAALGRAGILNVVFSQTPPAANQSTTAWFLTATPSYAAEGALYLWDTRAGTYLPATPELFLMFLMLSSKDDLLAIFAVNGAPTDDIGKDGDYAIRLDAPGGIYGPKAGGHWPTVPIPGTSYSQISAFLDWLGTTQGEIVYRGSTSWTVLQPGQAGYSLKSNGPNQNPYWGSSAVSSPDMDVLFGGVQGSIIYRGLSIWQSLPPGPNNYLLQTHGAAANPTWVSAATASLIGPVGPQGPVGATGATGPAGPQGPAGPPGSGGTGIVDMQLTVAGYFNHTTLGPTEPFPGAFVAGASDLDFGGMVLVNLYRYIQVKTTSWYTVAAVGSLT